METKYYETKLARGNEIRHELVDVVQIRHSICEREGERRMWVEYNESVCHFYSRIKNYKKDYLVLKFVPKKMLILKDSNFF